MSQSEGTVNEAKGPTIEPGDDRLHRRSEDPYWSESCWISLMVPERKLHGMLYMFHRPNMKLSAGGPFLWDPSGEDSYNCLYWGFDPCLAMPERAEMFDFSLDNGMSVQTNELLKSYRITFKDEWCALDLTWDAMMAPHGVKRVDTKRDDNLKGWWADEGIGHYDQAGRIRGTLDVEGETIEVDCFSMRDRSWGPRRPSDLRSIRLAYPWAVVSEEHSFLAPACSNLPPDKDPIVGTTEPIMPGGWYTRDGVLGDIVSGERRVVERGEDGRPLREVIDAADHLGRELHAEGVALNVLKWTGYGRWFDWYSLAHWEFDGQAAYGEMEEVYTFPMHRRLQKSLGRQPKRMGD